ncbi:MAG: twin-arginine translocase TatA/TatE family subunit [Candidatus Hydrogenedentes bacterium]|nr:twin-arginine translocase TatA/TatE family subunit [Candidatus Hydrogenedentota bacterium]
MIPHGWEIAIILLIGIMLFGAKRLPSIARGVAQSITELKTAVTPRDPESRGTPAK